MIKVNLISTYSEQSSLSNKISVGSFFNFGLDAGPVSVETIRAAVRKLIVIISPSIVLMIYAGQILPQKEVDLELKMRRVDELIEYNSKQSASVSEIKKFKEDQLIIEARIKALNKVSIDRVQEIKLIDLIQKVIPEKVWLKRVKIDSAGVFFEGSAANDFEISNFMESLTKSALLTEVNLLSSSDTIVDGQVYKSFELSCVSGEKDE
jgi:type IV pilus assembly protein PilN